MVCFKPSHFSGQPIKWTHLSRVASRCDCVQCVREVCEHAEGLILSKLIQVKWKIMIIQRYKLECQSTNQRFLVMLFS